MKSNSVFTFVFLMINILFFSFSASAEQIEVKKDIPYSKVAKAVIAKIMGRDPVSMIVKEHTEKGVWRVSYVRENDKTKWSYLVKFNENIAIWAAAGSPETPDYIGRWRDKINDEVISYEVKDDNVKIIEKYADGSYS